MTIMPDRCLGAIEPFCKREPFFLPQNFSCWLGISGSWYRNTIWYHLDNDKDDSLLRYGIKIMISRFNKSLNRSRNFVETEFCTLLYNKVFCSAIYDIIQLTKCICILRVLYKSSGYCFSNLLKEWTTHIEHFV